eukprot:TRINITY_DN123_c0_g2_i2.p1 TRINITY_DN123_c0_g2~~TRINITY_DN123_c0_g2_i2.p1  ORF type:complete len:165 (-),score=54.34 TRINITY_DN123_c0_g2_i2:354-848(-)
MNKAITEAEKSQIKSEIATALLGMGYLFARLPEPDLKKALECYQQAMKAWEEVLGADAGALAFVLHDIAALAAVCEGPKAAVSSLKRAARLLKATPIPPQPASGGKEPPFTRGVAMMQVAQIYMTLKQQERAVRVMQRTVKAMKSYNDPSLAVAAEVLKQISAQ